MTDTKDINNILENVISTVGDLPAAPIIISTAVKLTSNLESNIADISRVLSSDQSLTAKVFRLSNSPYYGRASEVNTLKEAIIVLGFMTVRSIVIATAAHNMFLSDEKNKLETKLWQHSLATAISAREIAKHLNNPEKEEIFVTALMHDIGKLVILQKLPEWFTKILNEVEENNDSFHMVEKRVFRFNHCDVASLLLKDWSFPPKLVSAIVNHHNPPSFRRDALPPISHIIHVANYMGKNLNVGFDDEKIEKLINIPSCDLLRLKEDDLDEIFEKVEENYYAEVRLFEED